MLVGRWELCDLRQLRRAGRTAVKAVLGRVLNDDAYGVVQSRVMANDIRRGRYTEPELGLVSQVVRRGECVLDIGANYGLYSYHLSRAVGPTGRVLAFEPIPFTAAVLRRVLGILDLENVEVIPIGCSDESGIVDFNLPVQLNGAPIAGLAHFAKRQDAPGSLSTSVRYDRRKVVRCEVAPVDSIVSPELDVSFVKVDVEGAELAVLRGSVKTLMRCTPTVVCELNPSLMEGFGYDARSISQFMENQGYLAYWYVDSKLVPALSRSGTSPNNWVFVHPRRRGALDRIIAL